MGQILEEVKLWNTPVVGSFLLWKFTVGYQNYHPKGELPVAILHFIAIAILTSDELKKPVSNRRDCLQSYIRSFEDSRNVDTLLSIHDRVASKLQYTWRSIDLALSRGLLHWNSESGRLYTNVLRASYPHGHSPKGEIKKDGDRAEILGKWFSQHDLSAITSYLKIVL